VWAGGPRSCELDKLRLSDVWEEHIQLWGVEKRWVRLLLHSKAPAEQKGRWASEDKRCCTARQTGRLVKTGWTSTATQAPGCFERIRCNSARIKLASISDGACVLVYPSIIL
jgi:hypothetical protein